MQRLLLLLLLPLLAQCRKLSSDENSVLQQQCGKPVPGPPKVLRRSMHTPKVSRSEAPWVAGILHTNDWFPNITIEQRGNDFLNDLHCTGSLISSRHVVTAAHCVVDLVTECTSDGTLITANVVRANIARLSVGFAEACKKDECQGGAQQFASHRVEVKQIFVSNKYTDFNCEGTETLTGGDLAVIELAEDVVLSDLLYPICLSDKSPSLGEQLSIFGYGLTGRTDYIDGLRRHNTTVDKCKDRPNFDTVCVNAPIALECRGDSGGGYVIHDRRGAAYVTGIVSGVSGADIFCSDMLVDQQRGPYKLPPGFMCDVSKHLTWICAATGICVSKEVTDTVKLYEEKGLTKNWYRLLTPPTGNDIYV